MLIVELKKIREQVVSGEIVSTDDCMESRMEAETKLMLINRALSILDH